MDDAQILKHIEGLMAEERHLLVAVGLTPEQEHRLHEIHVEIDQYWDLSRQRRALRAAGDDPNTAELRPPEVVENYRQ